MRDDQGTVLPLVVLSFLLAGLMVTAGTAASAAFLAQRDLAGVCDGAALAGAATLARSTVDGPVDATRVAAAVEDYRLRAARPGLGTRTSTEGGTVTVTCRRTVRIPFGAVLGKRDGLARTAVARARTELLTVHLRQTQWTVHETGCWRRGQDRGTVARWPPR